MKRIPITAAKRIAEEYGYDQVLIYARKVGDYGICGGPIAGTGGEHMTTYGVTKVHCGVVARIGKHLQGLMGWKV